MAGLNSCHSCGREAYIEHSATIAGPYMRLPGTIDITRNVTETAGPTACNELTGFVEQETCEGTTSTNWAVTGEECVTNPICNHINRGDCCFFRVSHTPIPDGTPTGTPNLWKFEARVGALGGVSYNKNTTIGWSYNLAVQGLETKPVF